RWSDFRTRPRLILAAVLALVLILTVITSWIQFKLLGIPLPIERTSIWFVPLATLLLGTAVSALPLGLATMLRISAAVRGLGIAILLTSAIYFIGELRDSYFRLWRFDAEVRTAFPVIVDLSRISGGTVEIATDPILESPLNFYKVANKTAQI